MTILRELNKSLKDQRSITKLKVGDVVSFTISEDDLASGIGESLNRNPIALALYWRFNPDMEFGPEQAPCGDGYTSVLANDYIALMGQEQFMVAAHLSESCRGLFGSDLFRNREPLDTLVAKLDRQFSFRVSHRLASPQGINHARMLKTFRLFNY